MQAMLVDSIRPGEWIYEIKFDGYRALALRGGNETRILSRNEKDLGGKFPEVKDAVTALAVQDAVIDGEIVALDDKGRSSLQLLQGFDMGLVRPPIIFYAFENRGIRTANNDGAVFFFGAGVAPILGLPGAVGDRVAQAV